MKLKVFCVYDSKVESYLNPFFMKTRGEALRAWSDVIEDKNSQFNKHPEDFTLFEIGEYDQDSGEFNNSKAKVSLGTALEFARKETH